MRTIKAEALSVGGFLPFGSYTNMINPDSQKFGSPPIEFFRDMIQQELGGESSVSFSTCRVEKREPIIDVSEYHSKTAEGLMPVDNDVLIHVGPAVPGGAPVPLDEMRVFIVPKGTFVVLSRGVWHHAPFACNSKPANILVVLPERSYANDCTVAESNKADYIKIEY